MMFLIAGLRIQRHVFVFAFSFRIPRSAGFLFRGLTSWGKFLFSRSVPHLPEPRALWRAGLIVVPPA